MRYPSAVNVTAVEKSIPREGFLEPYHRVTFDLVSEGIPTSEMAVWVHPAFPEAELIRVARTFLWSRLVALTTAADEERFSEDDIQSLWEEVKPENFDAH